MEDSEPGENVEKDQDLGGMTASRSVNVKRPVHVPVEASKIWFGAAQHLANKNQLLNAQGRVAYSKINAQYAKVMAHLGRVASETK
jgi:hypothetical protein